MYKIVLLLTGLALVTACGDKGSETASQDKVANPIQGQMDAMEKAKEVENVMQDATAEHQQQMEEQVQAAPTPAPTAPATGE